VWNTLRWWCVAASGEPSLMHMAAAHPLPRQPGDPDRLLINLHVPGTPCLHLVLVHDRSTGRDEGIDHRDLQAFNRLWAECKGPGPGALTRLKIIVSFNEDAACLLWHRPTLTPCTHPAAENSEEDVLSPCGRAPRPHHCAQRVLRRRRRRGAAGAGALSAGAGKWVNIRLLATWPRPRGPAPPHPHVLAPAPAFGARWRERRALWRGNDTVLRSTLYITHYLGLGAAWRLETRPRARVDEGQGASIGSVKRYLTVLSILQRAT